MKKIFLIASMLAIHSVCFASMLDDVASDCKKDYIKSYQNKNGSWIEPDFTYSPMHSAFSDEITPCVLDRLENLSLYSGEASYWLGRMEYEINNRNKTIAFKWFKKGAEQGDTGARVNYAYCLAKGIGTIQNKDLALQEFKSAANEGDGLASYNAGVLLKEKKKNSFLGLSGSDSDIKNLFAQSCDRGIEEGYEAVNLYDNKFHNLFIIGYFGWR